MKAGLVNNGMIICRSFKCYLFMFFCKCIINGSDVPAFSMFFQVYLVKFFIRHAIHALRRRVSSSCVYSELCSHVEQAHNASFT